MRKRSDWLGVVLIVLVLAAYTWATWYYYTRTDPGGNDFLTHYGAWEAFFKYGVSPYSEEAAVHTQIAIYGRPALVGEDQNRMVYPFYSILVHGPFVALNYAFARALYMVLLQVALFAGVILSMRLAGWPLDFGMVCAVFGWALLNYYQARGVLIGQFAILGFGALAGSLFLLRGRHDLAAGALLVVTTIKPPMVVLLVPFFLVWALARRRWNFLGGFVGTVAVLSLASLIVEPTWIGDWVYRMGGYTDYTFNQSTVYLLTHEALPALGTNGEWVLSGLLLAGMLWSWWRVARAEGDREFYWALGATLLVTNLITPRVATTNYVLMLVPLIWLFAALDRVPRWGRPVLVAVLVVSLIGPWWLHVVTVRGNWEHPIMYVPWPVLMGAAWVWGRAYLLRDAQVMGVVPS